MALYSIRSERLFCEQLDYHLLFRWFLDIDLYEPGWDHSTFTKNRPRLLNFTVGRRFFDEVVYQADARGLLSNEHFTVDGTLIEAAASLKSFRRRDGEPPAGPPDDPGNPSVDFHGERRSNATHRSTTDPEARLMRKGKGKEAKLYFLGHALMENRHGLLVDLQVSAATGTAEQEAVPTLLDDAVDRGFGPARWERTRTTTRRSASRISACGGARRTWPTTPRGREAARSTDGPRATRATR